MLKDYLIDLEIISQLKETDKLAIYRGKDNSLILIIDRNNYYNFIYRWYYNYNRNHCIKYIETLITQIEKEKIQIIENNNLENLLELKTSLINSKIGFINLQITYSNDVINVAKIQLLLNRIQNAILDLEEKLILNKLSINNYDQINNIYTINNTIYSTDINNNVFKYDNDF
jgi:hypothetical protein